MSRIWYLNNSNDLHNDMKSGLSQDVHRRRSYVASNSLSINQSNFYSANIPSEARLSGMTAKSVFNSKIDETVPWHQRAVGYASVWRGKAKSKRYVFVCLLITSYPVCPTALGELSRNWGKREQSLFWPQYFVTWTVQFVLFIINELLLKAEYLYAKWHQRREQNGTALHVGFLGWTGFLIPDAK